MAEPHIAPARAWKTFDIVAQIVTALLILHFLLSLAAWGVFIWMSFGDLYLAGLAGLAASAPWLMRTSTPVVLLSLATASCFVRRRSHTSANWLLAATIGLAAAFFAHDAITANYDFTTYPRRYPVIRETGHFLTWWWYTQTRDNFTN
jgi:hypothetical protein